MYLFQMEQVCKTIQKWLHSPILWHIEAIVFISVVIILIFRRITDVVLMKQALFYTYVNQITIWIKFLIL